MTENNSLELEALLDFETFCCRMVECIDDDKDADYGASDACAADGGGAAVEALPFRTP